MVVIFEVSWVLECILFFTVFTTQYSVLKINNSSPLLLPVWLSSPLTPQPASHPPILGLNSFLFSFNLVVKWFETVS